MANLAIDHIHDGLPATGGLELPLADELEHFPAHALEFEQRHLAQSFAYVLAKVVGGCPEALSAQTDGRDSVVSNIAVRRPPVSQQTAGPGRPTDRRR